MILKNDIKNYHTWMFTHYQRFHYARHLASLLHITILHFLTCLCLSLPLCPDWLRNLMMEWLNNNNPLTLIYKFNNKNYITVFEMPFVCVVSGWRISSAPALQSCKHDSFFSSFLRFMRFIPPISPKEILSPIPPCLHSPLKPTHYHAGPH